MRQRSVRFDSISINESDHCDIFASFVIRQRKATSPRQRSKIVQGNSYNSIELEPLDDSDENIRYSKTSKIYEALCIYGNRTEELDTLLKL